MDITLLAVLIGLGVGVVVGALGAGGGIIAVPVLVYLLGQDPHDAAASSLVIVGVTAMVSLVHHVRRGNVAWRSGITFAACSMLGAVTGARAAALVAGPVLLMAFGLLVGVVSVAMLLRGLRLRRGDPPAGCDPADAPSEGDGQGAAEATGTASVAEGGSMQVRSWPHLLAAATMAGLLTGFFGVGGGFIVVPLLVLALGLPMRRAAGTSLLVMVIVSAVGLASRIGTPVHVDWAVTLLFAAGSIVGGAVGGPLSDRARPSTLTLAFAGLLAMVAAVTLGERLLGG